MSGRNKRKNSLMTGKDIEQSKPGGGGNWWETANMQTTPNDFSTSRLNFDNGNSNEPKKKKRSNDPKTSRQPERFADSDSGEKENTKSEEEKENKPVLINLDAKSPPIWTFGVLIVYLAVLGGAFYQYGQVPKMSENPMFGPSQEVLLLMGAKQASVILAGSWWRFFTSMFLHSGAIHLVIILIFAIFTSRVERDTGFWRAFFVFLVSGMYGTILSCLLVPELISCGASGAIFGYIGLLFADLFAGWRSNPKKGRDLGILVGLTVVGIILGLTPFIDNFNNIGGFIMGLLFALMLLPNLSFGSCERICHGFISFLAFPAMAFIFCVCLVVFYRSINNVKWCPFCQRITCLNFGRNWCTQNSDTTPNQTTINWMDNYTV